MQWRELSDAFRLLFGTRIILLFIIGSIFLAVLGNAFYGLATAAFGTEPWQLGLLILLCFGALVLIVMGIVLHIKRRARPDFIVGSDKAPAKHRKLVVLVSPNPDTSHLKGAIEHHLSELKQCWLVFTADSRENAEDLRGRFASDTLHVYMQQLSDANDSRIAYLSVRNIFESAGSSGAGQPEADRLIADITGGTRPMAIGAILACLHAGQDVQYMTVPRDSKGVPKKGAHPSAMTVPVSLDYVLAPRRPAGSGAMDGGPVDRSDGGGGAVDEATTAAGR